MKSTIRLRLFVWLAGMLTAFISIQAVWWFLYELSEHWKGQAESFSEELEELIILLTIDAIVFPIILLAMWLLSKRMLRPLSTIADTAHRIQSGHMDERITGAFSDDEVGMLAESINSAFDRYHDAVERLRRFSADASHQLRTPLTAMRSTGEVCLQKTRTPKVYQETIGGMLEEVQRLSHTVEQLLTLARLESERVRESFTPLDVAAATEETAELYRQAAQDKKLALVVSARAGLHVNGNPALLQQVIANLLDNAIRHTPVRGEVHVSVEPVGSQEVMLTVADTGPGIPEAYRALVFDRFNSVPGLHMSSSGSGLGLAIVADIVRLHGGSVEIDSNGARGAVFRVRWPLVS